MTDSQRAGKFSDTEQSVASWAQTWLEQADGRRSEQTRRHYRERIGAFLAEFADRPLASFSKNEAKAWVDEHPANHTAVRAMFSDAERNGLIPGNPFTKLGVPKSGPERAGVLSPDELEELARVAVAVHGPYGRVVYGPMLMTAAWAGLEPGELYGLCPEDVDLEGQVLNVHRAMRGQPPALREIDPRHVALLPAAQKALEYAGVRDLSVGEPIFQTQQGKWVHQRLQTHYWQPVRDRFVSGLPEDHWLVKRIEDRGDRGKLMMGELRHLFGAQLAAANVRPDDVADMMGDRDGGKRARDLYFQGQAGSPVERALEAFRRAEAGT